ncbi:MAG: hypothetical protein AAFX50_03605, partial [Acidobacteriota bacterium]
MNTMTLRTFSAPFFAALLGAALLLGAGACSRAEAADADATTDAPAAAVQLPPASWGGPAAFTKPSKADLLASLSTIQYQVTQYDVTERPYSNE